MRLTCKIYAKCQIRDTITWLPTSNDNEKYRQNEYFQKIYSKYQYVNLALARWDSRKALSKREQKSRYWEVVSNKLVRT